MGYFVTKRRLIKIALLMYDDLMEALESEFTRVTQQF
jgi:hypothetical protein